MKEYMNIINQRTFFIRCRTSQFLHLTDSVEQRWCNIEQRTYPVWRKDFHAFWQPSDRFQRKSFDANRRGRPEIVEPPNCLQTHPQRSKPCESWA